MSTTNIRPLSDRVLVEPRSETTSAGGIVIPDTADKDKPMEGTVLAVGSGKFVDGSLQPVQVKVGDKVLFGKYAGTSVKLNNKDVLVMREDDVMAIID